MSWRGGQGITGSNNVPLGNRRRFGGDSNGDSYSAEPPKRGRSPDRGRLYHPYKRSSQADRVKGPPLDPGERRRKKRNRWGDASDNKAANLTGLPTMIKANMTNEQLEAYTLHLRIQEISEKLRINDVVPADGDRSPSPPPQYDNFGRRVNTREYRYRKKLEDERHKQIEKAMKIIPNYHPPSDYRRPTKTQEKVYVPVNDYPEINFIGLLIGPRGNTLKKMESESGAKIAIRGKGSVKEGKGRSDAAHTSNQEEDLHCLIMADTEDKVNKAKKLIHNVIETAASIPEGQNELKRNQLRELAALNGTLRDDENQACQNCGQIGHRKYDCPEQRNYTANIICRVCGNAGHMARDCPDRQRGGNWRNDGPPMRQGGDVHDQQYEQLMQELSGGAPGAGAQHRIEGGHGGYGNGGDSYGDSGSRPWERGSTGGAAPWRSGGDHSGGAAPWANGGRGGDNYGYGDQSGGYGAPGGAAPWQQGGQGGAPGYGAYPSYSGGGYGGSSGYPAPPPGLSGAPGVGGYGQYGAGGAEPPPPPPGGAPPPPPPGDAPPPPPPGDAPPPPPPGA